MSDAGDKVQLYIYDLSNGLARQMSMALIGKQVCMCGQSPPGASPSALLCNPLTPKFFLVQLEGVWHTAVVVGGREYYYGQGIQDAPAGSSPFGNPLQVVDLG